MDIRNVGKNGGVERSDDRPTRAGAKRDVVMIPFTPRDEARISDTSREAAAAVENLAERARRDDSGRQAIVAEAVRKLANGDLDSEASAAATARRLLDARFLSA